MIIKNPAKVMMKSLEESCGLTAYAQTLTLRDFDITTNKKYQKNFTAYYRVRREASWLQAYYAFMEENKNNDNLDFETILRHLATIPHSTGKGVQTTIEASFASKMLATINTDYPIWDSQVVKAMGIKMNPYLVGEEKIQAYIEAYAKLTAEIKAFIPTAEGQECIRIFDEEFPNYKHVSPMKKMDYYLWNLGK